jgi:penicillin-binding protein 1A
MQAYAEAAVKEHLTYLQAEFYKHWKGKTPWGENTDIILTSMRRSDRYQQLKEEGIAESEIKKIFDTPIKMTLFSWAGDIDTTLSPIDSIKYYKWYLRSSFMSMDPHNGAIKAWVGGPNYEYFKYDQVKMGKRQVGSTFKPFVYTVAMDNGWSPCYEAPNLPIVFEDFDNWSPKNSDGKQGGMMTLRNGLANSVNLITAFMMKQVGPQAVVNVAKKMGITSDIPAYPSICLGTADVSLYEMVGAYSTYANKGVWTEPVYISRIEDKNGNVLYEKIPRKVDALSEQTAYLMLYMLRGVIDKGTGLRLRGPRYRFTNPIAGKTGTTQENSDGWFIGITPDLVSGVWTGAEDRSVHFRSTNLGEGANTALPIWALYMKKVYADATLKISKGDFIAPAGGLDVEIDCDKFKKQSSGATNPSLDF